MRHHIRPLDAESIAGDGGGEDAVGSNELGGQEGQEALNADGDEQAPDMDHENAEGEQGHVVEEPVPEDPAVRPLRDPGQPTERERRQHELTHLPFRPWCADCVA